MPLTEPQITAYVGQFMWPLIRIGAMCMVMPVVSAKRIVPTRYRMGIAVVLTTFVAPMLPEMPAVEPLGFAGLAIAVHQLMLGVAMGFILQLAFSALVVAGHSVAMTMGLGFATFIDPTNGLQIPIISKFYTTLGTLLFLSLNGHLVAIQILVQSFETVPVGSLGFTTESAQALVLWGGEMFVGALLIALPALVTIKLINIAFGVITRAAPQINIFAVGFPTTMAVGFLILFLTLPNLLPRFTDVLMDAFSMMRHVSTPGG